MMKKFKLVNNPLGFHSVEINPKHFTLVKDMEFDGKIFRDTVHGITPDELAQLISEVSK